MLMYLAFQVPDAQAPADGFDAAVLPDDSIEDRFTCGASSHHGGFMLAGDAECGHVGGGELRLFKCGMAGGGLAVSDVERIMPHPAGLRKMLGKPLLGAGDGLAGTAENGGA